MGANLHVGVWGSGLMRGRAGRVSEGRDRSCQAGASYIPTIDKLRVYQCPEYHLLPPTQVHSLPACAYVFTHEHTHYTRTTHAYIYIYIYIYSRVYKCSHRRIHTRRHGQTHMHVHTKAQAHAHAYDLTYVYTL